MKKQRRMHRERDEALQRLKERKMLLIFHLLTPMFTSKHKALNLLMKLKRERERPTKKLTTAQKEEAGNA